MVVVKTGKVILILNSYCLLCLHLTCSVFSEGAGRQSSERGGLISDNVSPLFVLHHQQAQRCKLVLPAARKPQKLSMFSCKKIAGSNALNCHCFFFCYLRKIIGPNSSRYQNSGQSSPFRFRYMCLWFVVSVSANLTQTIPQVSVIAQEVLSPPTLSRVRVSAAASTY